MEVYFWNIFMILMGSISIVLSFLTHREQSKLKRNGLLAEAKLIEFFNEKSTDDSPAAKIPVFKFLHKDKDGTRAFIVKGKSNSLGEIGELTPIYYNPENPEKEYYLANKDFLMKYVMFFIGMFFFCLGILYMLKDLNYPTEDYFLYLIISLFLGTFLLYLIGLTSDMVNRKRINDNSDKINIKKADKNYF